MQPTEQEGEMPTTMGEEVEYRRRRRRRWSLMPEELLVKFLPRGGGCLRDNIRFASVCRSWRSAAAVSGDGIPMAWPLLALDSEHDAPSYRPWRSSPNRDVSFAVISNVADEYFKMLIPPYRDADATTNSIQKISYTVDFVGSSGEWLVALRRKVSSCGQQLLLQGQELLVFNPQTKESFLLPSSLEKTVVKIVLRPRFTPSSYVAAVIFMWSRLFLASSGDSRWTYVAVPGGSNFGRAFHDLSFDIDGNLYLLVSPSSESSSGPAAVVDLPGGCGGCKLFVVSDSVLFVVQRRRPWVKPKYFLVESSGEMLLVHVEESLNRIEVFKLELNHDGGGVAVSGPLASLGGRALLLSRKSSMSEPACGGLGASSMNPDFVYLLSKAPRWRPGVVETEPTSMQQTHLFAYDLKRGGRVTMATTLCDRNPVWFLCTSPVSMPIVSPAAASTDTVDARHRFAG